MINHKDYETLLKTEKRIRDSQSTTIKIDHEQVLEIVVADLLVKYRAAIKRKDKWVEPFRAVLLFYLEEEELDFLISEKDKS